MTRERLPVYLSATLALGLLVAVWFALFERVERWVDQPMRGEPTYNPLYALRQSLRADGIAAESRARLALGRVPLGVHDTLVLYSDPRALAGDEAATLMRWVERGGHLVVRVPRRAGPDDATRFTGPLAARLPVQPELLEPDCLQVTTAASRGAVRFCTGARFRLRPGATVQQTWGGPDGAVFARLPRGAGIVDVLGSLEFLDNVQLDGAPQRVLARQLLAPNYGRGRIHLVYSSDMPPLWRWLLERGWRAALPLTLALGLWLWMRMQRFGPALPAPPEARRSLLEHVQASGEHLLRYGRAALLQTALREHVLARLRRRDPLAAALTGEPQAQAIANRTGLSPAEVRAALDTRAPSDTQDFRQRITRLIALRNRL